MEWRRSEGRSLRYQCETGDGGKALLSAHTHSFLNGPSKFREWGPSGEGEGLPTTSNGGICQEQGQHKDTRDVMAFIVEHARVTQGAL